MSLGPNPAEATFECSKCLAIILSSNALWKRNAGSLYLFAGSVTPATPLATYSEPCRKEEKYYYFPKERFIKLEVDNVKCKHCAYTLGQCITDAPKAGPGTTLKGEYLWMRGRLIPALSERRKWTKEKEEKEAQTKREKEEKEAKAKEIKELETRLKELKPPSSKKRAARLGESRLLPRERARVHTSTASQTEEIYRLNNSVNGLKHEVDKLRDRVQRLENHVLAG